MRNCITILLLGLTLNVFTQNIINKIKPYDEVISSEIITSTGFLLTHLLKNKLFLEIPSTMLNKEMLFVKHGIYSSSKQVIWIKRENKIHLIIREIESKVGNTIPLIKDKFIKKITPATFPILAMGNNDSSYVIEVTSLFLNTPKELPGGGNVIFDDLAFINNVLALDNTIEVKTNKTIISANGPLTIDTGFSLLLLPEPMMPRLYDHRMGFFTDQNNLGTDVVRACISKWRLEKKDINQVLSEPIKPITFYFGPAIPSKWKPYIKAGIEEWLLAFEAAGFKKAIVVKEPPKNDKNWSMNSVRYSYIRWINRSKYRGHEGEGNGSVSTIIDQRTGEILKGDIMLGKIKEISDHYFIRCSPIDKRAQLYPFPDDLIGELIQNLTAHETGHVFGLKDGNYGEYTYAFEKMRDKKWLQKMGHTPSVMNYTRQNFIVQPEDNIPPSLLHQKVGPTDLYSIRWAYTRFNDANTPDEELPYLEKIVREQDSISWYRYNAYSSSIFDETGPGSTNEVVESDNPIKATILGVQNLKRVITLIPYATRNERGSVIKERLYLKTLQLWENEMKSVVSLVGGYTIQHKSAGQEGLVHTPVPAYRQKEAVAFLIKEAFNTSPLWMAPPSLTRRCESSIEGNLISSSINIISSRQIKIIGLLLNRARNLEEIELTTKNGYSIINLFEDLQEGLWSELNARDVKINAYRQQIQLSFIIGLKSAIERKQSAYSIYPDVVKNTYYHSNYIRGVMLSILNNLKNTIEKAIKNSKDIGSKGHLELCLMEIKSFQKLRH